MSTKTQETILARENDYTFRAKKDTVGVILRMRSPRFGVNAMMAMDDEEAVALRDWLLNEYPVKKVA